MTNHAGYAVEYKDGSQEMVYNLATARWYVREGLAERVYDTYTYQYILIKKDDS
jgi:hypothetical protein